MTYGKKVISHSGWMLGASSLAMVVALSASSIAYAQDNQDLETVVVTGFRASLEKALDMKRNSLSASDSIMAEDIAKFPDLNVSESLQRIPGVAIQRDSGEGRQISVRGLGPQFTRVRINGLEALATTGGADSSGGTNRSRSFDFNVFGSELFSGLTVQKSAAADTDEGSLGATVDMHTARPFDYNKFVLTGSLQAGYNTLAQTVNPRGSFLVSDTFLGGRLGVLVSGAYAVRHIIEDGTSTVRWQNDGTTGADGVEPGVSGCNSAVGCTSSYRFKSVTANGTTYTSGTLFDEANEAFHPRMPRYEVYREGQKRLGLSSTVQWQATDRTLFTLSGLYSDFAAQRDEVQLESTTLSGNATKLALSDYHVNSSNNTLDYMVANNMAARVEHRKDVLDTKFEQLTLDGSHEFSDSFKVKGMIGWSESHHRNPMQTTLTYDLNNIQGYTYDYRGSQSKMPVLNYGDADVMTPGSTLCAAGVSSCNAWYLSQVRMRPQYVYNSYRTAAFDVEWDINKVWKVMGGFSYKGYGYRTVEQRIWDGSSVANVETVMSAYNTPSTVASVASAYGSRLAAFASTPLSQYTTTTKLPTSGLNIPAGTPTTWLIPDIGKATELFNLNSLQFSSLPALGNNKAIHENDYGGWAKVSWSTDFYNIPVRGDIGARMVETETAINAYNIDTTTGAYALQQNLVRYHDFLPAFNLVVEPQDDLVVRVNLAQVMARPDLGDLAGTMVSVSGTSRTLTVGNPNLKPFRANTADLSFEWYYGKGAMLSVAGFYKKVGTYIQSYSSKVTGTATGADFVTPYGAETVIPLVALKAACGESLTPPLAASTTCSGLSWVATESINTPGGHIDGVEVNLQQPFTFLPNMFENLGVILNGTYVDSAMQNGTGTTASVTRIINQSKWSSNATLYYDDTVFQARLSAAYRSRYLTRIPGKYSDVEGMGETFNLDASGSYRYNDNLTFTVDALNLTNQFQYQYNGSASDSVYVNHQTGTELYIGVRYSY